MKKHTMRWAVREAKRVEALMKEMAELKAIETQIVGGVFKETLWKALGRRDVMKKIGEVLSQAILA